MVGVPKTLQEESSIGVKSYLSKGGRILSFSFQKKLLAVGTIKGYRLVLSMMFRYRLPEISLSVNFHDLLKEFAIQRPLASKKVISWDLVKVLESLRSVPYEPLRGVSLKFLTMKALFLVSLASVKRVGELQGVSAEVLGEEMTCVSRSALNFSQDRVATE